MRLLDLPQLNPVPRGANYRCWDAFHLGPCYMYAHQLLYIFAGTGSGRIGEDVFPLEPGVLSLYGPGVRYEFSSTPGTPLTAATMCFSWCQVSARQLSVGNRSARSCDDAYWTYTDPEVQLEGLPPFPFHWRISSALRPRLEELLRDLGTAWRLTPDHPLLRLKAKAVLLELVFLLRRQLARAQQPPEPPALERFRCFVAQHYAAELSRADAAAAAGVSESHLTALLIRHCHSNFSGYLNQIRLRAATELLQYSTLSVKEIAAATGFHSSSYFVACFRRRYGCSPGRARRTW